MIVRTTAILALVFVLGIGACHIAGLESWLVFACWPRTGQDGPLFIALCYLAGIPLVPAGVLLSGTYPFGSLVVDVTNAAVWTAVGYGVFWLRRRYRT